MVLDSFAGKVVGGGHLATEPIDFSALGKEQCNLAKKVPAVPKGLSKRQKDEAEASRTALVKTIDILWKSPQLMQRVWSYTDQAVLDLQREDKAADLDLWPEACKKLGQVLNEQNISGTFCSVVI